MTAHADERSDLNDIQRSVGVKYYRVDDWTRDAGAYMVLDSGSHQ